MLISNGGDDRNKIKAVYTLANPEGVDQRLTTPYRGVSPIEIIHHPSIT